MRHPIMMLFACLVTADVQVRPIVPDPPAVVAQHVITAAVTEIVSYRVPRHVLIVGDSEACRVGFWVKSTVKQINDDANWPEDQISVECKDSTRVSYWNERIKGALDRHPDTDTLLVFLGTNHYYNVQTPPVGPILEEVRERGLNCVWVGNTAVNGRHWPVNELLEQAVRPTCDYFDTEAANIPLRDGVHPDHDGAVKWIKEIWKTIPPLYEENDE